jgi:hypothetical protein
MPCCEGFGLLGICSKSKFLRQWRCVLADLSPQSLLPRDIDIMAFLPHRAPDPPGGRLPLWFSPWLWAGAGLLLGALVVAIYIVGALSGFWPWAPSAVSPPSVEETSALPKAGPVKPGDCLSLQVPLQRDQELVPIEGRVCLLDNGSWIVAPLPTEAKK